jgi:DNA-binding SARP family transcriptional activator
VSVQVRVLGPLEVEVTGRGVIDLPDQLRGVLAALALLREPIAKADLARTVLFIAPRSIDSRLSRLRRALDLDRPLHRVTAPRSGLIELDRSVVEVDIDEFDRHTDHARQAVNRKDPAALATALLAADYVWRGLPEGPWVTATEEAPIARIVSELAQRRRVMCAYAADLMVQGRMTMDPRRLQRWCLERPDIDEVWFARVVDALDRSDARGAGLFLDRWRSAVGGSEHPRLRRATRLVELGPRPTAAPARRSIGPVSGAGPAEHDAAALEEWIDKIAGGERSVRVLIGEPGATRARLVDHAATFAAHRGLRVLRADAATADVLRALLEPMLADLLRDPATSAQLDPAIDTLLSRLTELPALQQIATPLLEVMRAATAASPLLVVVDNGDASTPELDDVLAALADADLTALGILTATRDRGAAWRAALPPWSRLDVAPPDPPLDRGERGDAHIGIDIDIDERESFRARSCDARRALAFVAITATDTVCDVDLARALDPDIGTALDVELADARVLRTIDGTASFVDARWAQVAWAALDPLERRQLHGRAVDLLDAQLRTARDPTTVKALADRLAHHADQPGLGTGPRARAVQALTRAAGVLAPLDGDHAGELYGRALDLTGDRRERLALLMERAQIRWSAADWNGAEEDLAMVVAQTDAVDDVTTTTEALLLTAWLAWDPTRAGGSLRERLRAVLDRLPPREQLLRARVQACLAGGLYQDGTSADPSLDASSLAHQALEALDSVAVPAGGAVQAEVLWWARKGLLDVVDPTTSAELSARLRAVSQHSSHLRGNAVLATIVDQLVLGNVADARTWSARYADLAEQTASVLQQYVAATLRGLWALHDGRHAEVHQATAEAEKLGAGFGGVTVTQVVEGQRILAARDLGRFRDDPSLVEVVEALTPVDGPIPLWVGASAWLRAEVGDFDTAVERLETIATRTADLTAVVRGPHRLPLLAFVAETLERIRSFDESTARSRELAGRVYGALEAHHAAGVLLGWPVAYLGPKAHFLGLAAAAAGDDDRALVHLNAACRMSEPTSPVNLRAQLAIASVLARDGQIASARRTATRLARRAEISGLSGVVADTAIVTG